MITVREATEVLKTFKNGKSPGDDEFTVEFYKQFFVFLGQDLLHSLNAAYESCKMPVSQRRGVRALIHREESNLQVISGWRPITLLNVDYKLASKVIAMFYYV